MSDRNVLLLLLGGLLLVVSPSVRAENRSGIAVKATGVVKLRADVLEMEGQVGGNAEIASDAITKYRSNRQRAVEAIEALQIPQLKIDAGRIEITSGMDAAQIQARMRGMAVQAGANRPLNVSEPLSIRLDGIDKLTNDQILETLIKIVDAGKDAGIALGGKAGNPTYNPFTGSYESEGPALARFRLSDVEGARQKAFEEAMKNARRQAERLAKLAELPLGSVRSITETTVTQQPQPVNYAYGVMTSTTDQEARSFTSPSLQDITVTASVDVEFEIAGSRPTVATKTQPQ